MISDPIAIWHRAVEAKNFAAIEDLLAEDAVFYSPVVHSPQAGKALTAKYLRAAMAVLNTPNFRYVGEWRSERSAVLEFEVELEGIVVNGVDIIRWNEQGRIVLFKVMMRPLKALNFIMPLMAGQLQAP
ncbi:MAG: nuclear transport factor 2 family protein [Micropepsaceae bacterium]